MDGSSRVELGPGGPGNHGDAPPPWPDGLHAVGAGLQPPQGGCTHTHLSKERDHYYYSHDADHYSHDDDHYLHDDDH